MSDKPMAAKGLISYRARSPYGWVMIAATNDADAMREARRSTPDPKDLQVWSEGLKLYVPVTAIKVP